MIRINLSTTLITLVAISALQSTVVFANEQKNTTDAKPESPLWQISSTQSSAVPTSSSIATSIPLGPFTSSSHSPPASSVPSIPVSQPHNTARDEIYIDDEGLEGSGGRGEIHDDLEKEPEYSGSGFGPDDEDSTSHERNKKKGHKSNLGNNGHKAINSKSKEQDKNLDTKVNKKQPEKNVDFPDIDSEIDGDLETGSGDGGIDPDSEIDQTSPDSSEREGEDETGHGGSIPNVKTDTENGKIGEDEDDLTTIIEEKNEKADGIPIDKPNILDPETDISGEGNEIELDKTGNGDLATGKPASGSDHSPTGNDVFIMDNRGEDRTTSFFAQPGILAAVIGGAVVGLLCAILVVMFIVYRMRKKDEGSYALDEPKRSPAVNSYAKNANNREFYA